MVLYAFWLVDELGTCRASLVSPEQSVLSVPCMVYCYDRLFSHMACTAVYGCEHGSPIGASQGGSQRQRAAQRYPELVF